MKKNTIILNEEELLELLSGVITEQEVNDDGYPSYKLKDIKKIAIKDLPREYEIKGYHTYSPDGKCGCWNPKTQKTDPCICSEESKKESEKRKKETKVKKEDEVKGIQTGQFTNCYNFETVPQGVNVTKYGNGNFKFSSDDEFSGWDVGEEYFDIEFELKPIEDNIISRERFISIEVDQSEGKHDAHTLVQIEQGGKWKEWAQYSSGWELGGGRATDNIKVKIKVPSSPSIWKGENQMGFSPYVWNWQRYAGYEGSFNSNEKILGYDAIESTVNVTTNITFTMWTQGISMKDDVPGNIYTSCSTDIKVDVDFTFGRFAKIVWRKIQLASVYDRNGKYVLEKSNWNPLNWDITTVIDVVSIIVLIFVPEPGSTAFGVGRAAMLFTYGGLVLTNAMIYYHRGNLKMAGFHLLLEMLPYVKLTKRIAAVVNAGGKAYAKLTNKALNSITKVSGKTLKSNKAALKILKDNPVAADMVRAIAKGGDDVIKKMTKDLSKKVDVSKITDEMADEFIEAVVKQVPDLAGAISKSSAKIIIAQAKRTFASRMLKTFATMGNIVLDATLLIVLYDADMIWAPIQLMVLDRDQDELTSAGIAPIWGITKDATQAITDYFGVWRVKDLITTTKRGTTGVEYTWEPVRAAYVSAISNPKTQQGKCSTIPSTRWDLYEKYKYEATGDGYEEEAKSIMAANPLLTLEQASILAEKEDYNSSQVAGTAGDYMGVPFEAQKMIGQGDVNTALKADWLTGWRPEDKCHERDAESLEPSEDDLEKRYKNIEDNPELDIKYNYNRFISAAATKYYDDCGEYLVLDGIELKETPTKEVLAWLLSLSEELRECVYNVADYYEKFDSIPDQDVFVNPEPLTVAPCNELTAGN